MTRFFIAAVLLSLLHAAPIFCQQSQLIHLKDGTSVKGTIVSQDSDKLVVKSEYGSLEIGRERIQSIDYSGSGNSAVQSPTASRDVVYVEGGNKSPALSWALSFFLLPGLGQYYNGEALKGTIQLGASVGGVAAALAGAESDSDAAMFAGGLVYFGAWVWSFVDAPMTSVRINMENKLARHGVSALLQEKNSINAGLSFSF